MLLCKLIFTEQTGKKKKAQLDLSMCYWIEYGRTGGLSRTYQQEQAALLRHDRQEILEMYSFCSHRVNVEKSDPFSWNNTEIRVCSHIILL